MQVATIGLDLAKHVFQIHGIDAAEKVVAALLGPDVGRLTDDELDRTGDGRTRAWRDRQHRIDNRSTWKLGLGDLLRK